MTGNPQDPQRGRLEDLGRKIDEQIGTAFPRAEEELRRVIAYLNEEVVPQVRRNSSDALKLAADQLHRLAEGLERARSPQRTTESPQSPTDSPYPPTDPPKGESR